MTYEDLLLQRFRHASLFKLLDQPALMKVKGSRRNELTQGGTTRFCAVRVSGAAYDLNQCALPASA
jgi:hypothetical protein